MCMCVCVRVQYSLREQARGLVHETKTRAATGRRERAGRRGGGGWRGEGEMEGAHIACLFAKPRYFLKVPQNLQKYVCVCVCVCLCVCVCVCVRACARACVFS
jgi:hypothetical protein